MKSLKKNQSGFGAVEVVLIIVIVAILGAVGWYVLKAKKNATTSYNNASSASTVTKPTNKTTNQTVDSYVGWKTYNSSALDATFKYPADWTESNSPTNGVFLISRDFHAGQGVANISAGSDLEVSQNPSTGETLDQAANGSNNPVSNKKNLTVDGVQALEYSNANTGEDQDSSLNVIIIRGNTTYYINQLYKLGADNPYPNLMKGVIATFKFKS